MAEAGIRILIGMRIGLRASQERGSHKFRGCLERPEFVDFERRKETRA